MKADHNIMTLPEASKYLKVHIATLYQLAQQKGIPASKVGGLWRFRKTRLEQWLDKQENTPPRKRVRKLTRETKQ